MLERLASLRDGYSRQLIGSDLDLRPGRVAQREEEHPHLIDRPLPYSQPSAS